MSKWTPSIANYLERHTMDDVFLAGGRNHHISNTAYPIAHGETWKPYKIKKAQHLDTTIQAFSEIEDFSLYSHIPFCESYRYGK